MITNPVLITIAERGDLSMPRLVEEALAINQQDTIVLADPSGKEQMRVRVALAFVSCEALFAYVYKEQTFLHKWGAILATFVLCGLVSAPVWAAKGPWFGLLAWLAAPALVTVMLLAMRFGDNKKWEIARAEVKNKLLSLQERLKENPDAV